jgi:hypothetical protein
VEHGSGLESEPFDAIPAKRQVYYEHRDASIFDRIVSNIRGAPGTFLVSLSTDSSRRGSSIFESGAIRLAETGNPSSPALILNLGLLAMHQVCAESGRLSSLWI